MRYKVIGAGFGRTGTVSMKIALEKLGFFPCYHMGEVFIPRPGYNDGHLDAWYDFYEKGQAMDWQWLFESYQATVDFPACLHYRELIQTFPDAVVVLNVRDPDKWFDSWQHLWSVIDTVNDPDKIVRFHKFYSVAFALRDEYFGGKIERESSIAAYNQHLDAVRRDVPANKLLEFSVTEGWKPLCEFLNLDVPDSPFPHLNEREGMLDIHKFIMWTNEPIDLIDREDLSEKIKEFQIDQKI